MKRFQPLFHAFSALLILAGSVSAFAQRPAPPAVRPQPVGQPIARGPGHTATIDMQRILADCQKFQEQLAELRAAKDEHHAHVKRLQDDVMREQQMIKQYTPGSPEHGKRTRRLFTLQGELSAAEQIAKYEDDRAEVVLYTDFYRRVETTTSDYAQRHGISLVVNRPTPARFAPEVTEAKQLFEQRTVYEQDVDITDEILMQLGAPKVRLQVPKTMSE